MVSQSTLGKYLCSVHRFVPQKMILLMVWVACLPVHALEDNHAQTLLGPDFKIVAQSVEKSGSFNRQSLYTLSYRFEFGNRDQIFLKEVGNIEARGEITYLSPSKVVEFWSRDHKEKLTTVEFQETVSFRGGEAEKMPAFEDFLPTKRTSSWPKNLPAKLNILKIINSRYPRGARAWIENDTQYFETLYEPLGSLPRGVLGQVALLITFPNTPSLDPYDVDLRAAIQERRRLENWRSDGISPDTLSSADRFVALFAAELERAAGSQ